jgi:hypothetical protein
MSNRKLSTLAVEVSVSSVGRIALLLIVGVCLCQRALPTPPPCTNQTDAPQGTVECPGDESCALVSGDQCSGEKFLNLITSVDKSRCVSGSGSNYEVKDTRCVKKMVCVYKMINGNAYCVGEGATSYVTVPQCLNKGGDCSL